MTSTYAGKPKPQLAIDNRRKRNVLWRFSNAGHIAGLYENAIRAVLLQGTTEERFHTSVGVHQGCRAVANGPVGPAMAGPIIVLVILVFLVFF